MMKSATRFGSCGEAQGTVTAASQVAAMPAMVSRIVALGVVVIELFGAPAASQAQYFDNRPTMPIIAARTVPEAGGCPSWLAEPYVVEALRQSEPRLAQELDNKAATARLLGARSLAGHDLLFDKVRSDLGTVILGATVRNSRSPRRQEEASEHARFFEQMSFDTMTMCVPRIANVLSEVEGQVAVADKADADREAQARSPKGRLLTVYGGYEALQACLRGRAGRVVAYVTSDDVEDAKRKAKAVEQRLLREDPSLDVNAVWADATKPVARSTDLLTLAANPDMVGRYDVDDGEFSEQGKAYCQRARRRIDSVYGDLFADAAKPKKDF